MQPTKFFANPNELRWQIVQRGINFTNAVYRAGIDFESFYDALHADRELSPAVAQKLRRTFGDKVIREVHS